MKPTMNKLVNYETGEVIDLSKASPKEITQALSLLIIKRKELQAVEAQVKKHIKGLSLSYDENANGILEAQYGLARVRKSYRESFDKKRFELEGTEQEKRVIKLADKIEKKYPKLTEVITLF